LLCKGRGFCGAMGNDASWVTVVDVCRRSLVRDRLWARVRFKIILLHWCRDPDYWLLRKKEEGQKGGECNGCETAGLVSGVR
jgi:hypothetical protein